MCHTVHMKVKNSLSLYHLSLPCVCQASWPASRDCPVSASCVTVGALELQTHIAGLSFTWGVGIQTQILTAASALCLPASSRQSRHPLCTRSSERRASQGSCLILYSTSPHPSLRFCRPASPPSLCVSHSVLRAAPGCRGPMKLTGAGGEGARHLHSTSRGCSDLTCNSSDKSLSAMPMAESVATLFVLISSEQISSSQRLAGSYRFLINVVTDFSRLGPGWDWGLGGNGGLGEVLARGR